MKSIILLFFLLKSISIVEAADPKPTAADFFALYPTIPDDVFHRQFAPQAFEYEDTFSDVKKPRIIKGFYSGKPVVTLDQVAKIETETREISAAPISGLRIVLNDSGIRQLRDYLRQANAKEMVVFVDGYAYATVSLDLARQMSEHRILWVVLPRPWEPISQRFLKLLAERLQSKITGL
jgi:hypothetical protein